MNRDHWNVGCVIPKPGKNLPRASCFLRTCKMGKGNIIRIVVSRSDIDPGSIIRFGCFLTLIRQQVGIDQEIIACRESYDILITGWIVVDYSAFYVKAGSFRRYRIQVQVRVFWKRILGCIIRKCNLCSSILKIDPSTIQPQGIVSKIS